MIVLFLSICSARVSVQSRTSTSFAEEVRNGEQRVTRFAHHKADVTQMGQQVTAHETMREQKRQENAGFVTQQDLLKQAAGKKNEQDAVTKMREAMGYSVKPQGKTEKGQLTITEASNMPGPIAGVYFNPPGKPEIDISRFSCGDGRCAQTMGEITGKDSSVQNSSSGFT